MPSSDQASGKPDKEPLKYLRIHNGFSWGGKVMHPFHWRGGAGIDGGQGSDHGFQHLFEKSCIIDIDIWEKLLLSSVLVWYAKFKDIFPVIMGG